MRDPLNLILRRLELDPPRLSSDELPSSPGPQVERLMRLGVLQPATPSAAIDCPECGVGETCRVEYMARPGAEKRRAFICCAECGVVQIDERRLGRWAIDTPRLLQAVFGHSVETCVPTEIATALLWRIGKARWAGRPRDLFFLRACRRQMRASILGEIQCHPKAILFTPTETTARHYGEATENLLIPLDRALAHGEEAPRLDVEYVESSILDAGMGPGGVPKPRAQKRASRTANIESLKKAIVEHLRAARDHAFDTLERTGQPQLLPRPSRKELGVRACLPKYQVTKCFQDPEARELNLYWDTALDLGQIMAWKGPVQRGRAAGDSNKPRNYRDAGP